MAMMTLYFDDSGTHRQSKVAIAACFLSDVRRWKDFEDQWTSELENAGILDCGFHMADFEARSPRFDWGEEKRSSVLAALVRVINKYALAGMAAAVVKSDYNRFVTGKLRKKLGQYPYTFAVQACLAQIEQWRVRNATDQPMEYIFDWMTKGKGEIDALFDDILEQKLAMHFGIEPQGWAFQNRKTVFPLQAADILAWEANRYMHEHQFTGAEPRPSFKSVVDAVEMTPRFYDVSSLPEIVSDLTAKYRKLNWRGPLGGFLPELTQGPE
ncbi:MAG TPA: DUF3800 domain-containing protein [Bryobacteraceae bacterium]|nr:DUF3800 domain-containing protein [Bryobacteraceae bacterium]